MDSTEENNENSEFLDDEGTKRGTSQLNEENQGFRVSLRKKETAKSEDNDRLLRHEKEPVALESVHKYANRIKSFLGWELNLNELEIKEDRLNASGNADNNNAAERDCVSRGDDLNGVENCCVPDEEMEVTPLEILQLNLENPLDLQTNLPNGSPLDISSQSESNDIPTKIEDNVEDSRSVNIPSDDTFGPVSSENTSVPEVSNKASTIQKTEHEESPDLISSASFDNILVEATNKDPVQENNTSYTDLVKADGIEEPDKEAIVSNLERPAPESIDLLSKDTLSSQSTSTIDVEEDRCKENGIIENVDYVTENENALDLDKNDPLRKNIKKPYMDEIRRLSIDIVKEVIESARNSVHEMFVNKNEQESIHEDEGLNQDHYRETNIVNGHKNLEPDEFKCELNITDQSTTDCANFAKSFKEVSECSYNRNLSCDPQDLGEYIIDTGTICGYGCYKPQWIQRYATPKIFLLFFSILGVLNGTYYAYFVSIISTLEKRYAFKTKVSGTLLLADEITPLILGVIVGYFGGKTHRPRMVAFGMFLSALCCFISGLPYLVYGPVEHLMFNDGKNETGLEFCGNETAKESCNVTDRPPTMTVVGILLLASFLKGFATLSYYIIGISYIDDVVKKKNTPMYLAISLALRLLGPLLGFLMSSAFLKIYENPFEDPGFGTDDPRWIGAWWMGFFLQGVLLLIFTIPIALFPRRLPSQKKLEKVPSAPEKENFRETLKGLVSALKRLGKNPIFIVLIVNTTMKIFGHFGHAIMLPKYMENQFRLSASDASLFSGATSIFCVMISTVFGGFLIWKFRPRIKVLLAGMVASEVVLSVGFLILMIPRCQPPDMLHFGMNDEGLILNSVCNQNCECSTTSFTPFCGPDGRTTYFSPCYAGCTEELIPLTSSKKQKEFGNCSCVSVADSSIPVKITEGFCPDENCWSKALLYLIILFIMLTVSNTFTVAHTMILLRSVHPADKSMALGTFETFICLFGFIPFPVTFGALVDSACLVWEQSCGETGNCWFYDLDKYTYLLHGAAALFCSFSTICLITLYFLSSRLRNLYEEDDEGEHIDNIKLDTVSGSVTKL